MWSIKKKEFMEKNNSEDSLNLSFYRWYRLYYSITVYFFLFLIILYFFGGMYFQSIDGIYGYFNKKYKGSV